MPLKIQFRSIFTHVSPSLGEPMMTQGKFWKFKISKDVLWSRGDFTKAFQAPIFSPEPWHKGAPSGLLVFVNWISEQFGGDHYLAHQIKSSLSNWSCWIPGLLRVSVCRLQPPPPFPQHSISSALSPAIATHSIHCQTPCFAMWSNLGA